MHYGCLGTNDDVKIYVMLHYGDILYMHYVKAPVINKYRPSQEKRTNKVSSQIACVLHSVSNPAVVFIFCMSLGPLEFPRIAGEDKSHIQ